MRRILTDYRPVLPDLAVREIRTDHLGRRDAVYFANHFLCIFDVGTTRILRHLSGVKISRMLSSVIAHNNTPIVDCF